MQTCGSVCASASMRFVAYSLGKQADASKVHSWEAQCRCVWELVMMQQDMPEAGSHQPNLADHAQLGGVGYAGKELGPMLSLQQALG